MQILESPAGNVQGLYWPRGVANDAFVMLVFAFIAGVGVRLSCWHGRHLRCYSDLTIRIGRSGPESKYFCRRHQRLKIGMNIEQVTSLWGNGHSPSCLFPCSFFAAQGGGYYHLWFADLLRPHPWRQGGLAAVVYFGKGETTGKFLLPTEKQGQRFSLGLDCYVLTTAADSDTITDNGRREAHSVEQQVFHTRQEISREGFGRGWQGRFR